MRTILEAYQLSVLAQQHDQREQPSTRRIRTAAEVCADIYADAEQRGRPFRNITPEQWTRRWLGSRRFFLMRIPIHCAALPCEPRDREWMLSRIHAETSDGTNRPSPITVDINKNGVGRTPGGFAPPIIVIDGKHRFAAASIRGSSHIWAWVGELAAERIKERRAVERSEANFRETRPVRTPFDRVLELTSGGQTREPLHHILARDLGMDPMRTRDLVAQYKVLHSHGRFNANKEYMHAKSPAGWSKTVEKMKSHPEIDNPFALAHWMNDQGYKPKGGD